MNNRNRNQLILKFSLWMALVLLVLTSLPLALAQTSEDVVFKALEDELSRTVQKLKMENLDKPYYVGYVLTEFQDFELDGSFGTISRKEDSKKRYLTVDLRVGDYAFDNTNFIGDWFGLYQQPAELTLEDNYEALRQEIWLATDQAYKRALEKLAQKKAYVQTKTITDLPEDFSKEKPYTEIEPKVDLSIDQSYWEKGVEDLSAIFKGFPEKEKIKEKIKELAQKTLDLSRAEQIAEYVGPVIFTGQASGEFFRQLLAANISSPRTPLLADERLAGMVQKSKLSGKLNRRILPSFFNVADDPLTDDWNGIPLIGGYKIDDEGVLAQKVSLVEKGKLMNLFMSRIPTKKIKQSNGHARGSAMIPTAGRQANLFIIPEEKTTFQTLKSRLLEYCKDMGLEYGVIITKLRDKNFRLETDPNTDLTSVQLQADLCFPVEAYKVYVKDGKEELIRGLEFEGTTVRALKDISEAGDDAYVYNFLLGHNFELPVSIVAPSILVEELELKKTEAKPSKPPILKSPFAEK